MTILSKADIQEIFNPTRQTVETRIKTSILELFDEDQTSARFAPHRWDFNGYVEDVLEGHPWHKQTEISDSYILALRQQHEKRDYEAGLLPLDDLEFWQPGQIIQNWIGIDAGHTVGKTWALAKFVSHFFDCFSPSIVYCFAPSSEQINDLLFKEIRVDRRDRDLPGVVLPRTPRINYKEDHFVTGKATNNSLSTGTERTHGQHGQYLLFIVDEAEGIPEFIWNAIRSMTSGGITMVIFARNPRTTICDAHEIRSRPNVKEFTISCLDTPNVLENREIVSSLVMRDYVIEMLDSHAEQVPEHNKDHYTFELPWQPGTIYRPQPEFCYRVLGIAPENVALNTFCPYGRYDGAVERGKGKPYIFTSEHEKATIGVDAARFGDDFGTVWIMRGDWLWRSGNFQTSDSFTFYNHIIEQMILLVSDGVVQIEIRVDAGGGWGSGVIDLFNHDAQLQYRNPEDRQEILDLMTYATTQEQRDYLNRALASVNGNQSNPWAGLIDFHVYEVNFDGTSSKPRDFYNLVTEMYYYLGESMHRLCLKDAPKTLREDLCARTFDYGMRDGYSVKVLSPKKRFKTEHKRSPDDGDGAALAAAPSHIFKIKPIMLAAG